MIARLGRYRSQRAALAWPGHRPGHRRKENIPSFPFVKQMARVLPMLFAPQDDQLIARSFEPPSPKAAWLSVWAGARACGVLLGAIDAGP